MCLQTHMRTRDGTPVEVLAQGQNFGDGRTVAILYKVSGEDRVGYRLADGKHPNAMTNLDLIEYDIASAAHHIQTGLDQSIFTAIRTLWLNPRYRPLAVNAAVAGTTIHVVDMNRYLEGLWGR